MNFKKRIERRERQTGAEDAKVLRVVMRCVVGRANLANSQCRRTLGPNGTLLEFVQLDGGRDGLSDEQLDQFVESFPIETASGTR